MNGQKLVAMAKISHLASRLDRVAELPSIRKLVVAKGQLLAIKRELLAALKELRTG